MRFFCSQQKPLRLRVVASSDSPADQAIKSSVRDKVLPLALQNPADLAALKTAARSVDPTASVRRRRIRLEGRVCQTIQITLGAGQGRNWWCLLYPSVSGLPEGPALFESWLLKLLRGWGWI